jgi:hypothetical protein
VDLVDAPALEAIGREMRGLARVHVDLGGVRFGGLALAAWLADLGREVQGLGGAMTIARAPRSTRRAIERGGLGTTVVVAAPHARGA